MTNFLDRWDLRNVPIPSHIEHAIVTPHSHESLTIGSPDGIFANQPINRPIWLIWKRIKFRNNVPDFPQLDTVCDNEESARLHYRMVVSDSSLIDVWVERVPANHRFASSLGEWQVEAAQALWKERADRNKKEGD